MFRLINIFQTKEDRRAKYWLALSLGFNSAWARRMRDWRLAKLERFCGLEISNKLEPEEERVHHHMLTFNKNPKLKTIDAISPSLFREKDIAALYSNREAKGVLGT
jgi:hypothetical protein